MHRGFICLTTSATLCAFVGCAQIYIDEERYEMPSSRVVRGLPAPNLAQLRVHNQSALTHPLPNEIGGRLFDAAAEPYRIPAPGDGAAPLSFQEEWGFFNSGVSGGPPRVCIALSGGGIRAAAFSLGVLSALHDTGVLKHTDILSAVSGGAYTLSWYYAQHYNHASVSRDVLDQELFALDGRYQTYLAENARVFNKTGYYALGFLNALTIPVNFLLNGVVGWHVNTTPARAIYEQQLRNTFHTPLRNDGFPAGDPPTIKFDRLATITSMKHLPYFVLNTTAFIEDTVEHLGGPLYNSIYEFTPLFFGSDSLGRFRYQVKRDESNNIIEGGPLFPLSFGRAVAISGAALDGTKLIAGNSQRTLWSLLNQDLGYYMNNPALSTRERIQHRVLPFPLYFFHHYPRDLGGTEIYLSDGGHSENLGVYALVRRLCETIIIVDGEHDPGYEFEAYHTIKKALIRDMNVDLTVPDIDRLRDMELKDIRRDAALRESWSLPEDFAFDFIESERWKTIAKKPVMNGTIACLPYPERDGVLRVKYVKLAYYVDQNRCGADSGSRFANCRAQGFSTDDCWKQLEDQKRATDVEYAKHYFCYTRRTSEYRKNPRNNFDNFPQQPTSDQSFDQWQFKAYRALGYTAGSQIKNDNIKVDASILCARDPSEGTGPADRH